MKSTDLSSVVGHGNAHAVQLWYITFGIMPNFVAITYKASFVSDYKDMTDEDFLVTWYKRVLVIIIKLSSCETNTGNVHFLL